MTFDNLLYEECSIFGFSPFMKSDFSGDDRPLN